MSNTTMQHDRDYWRCCDNLRLIEEARDSGHELTIALGERLASVAGTSASSRNLEREIDELEDELHRVRMQVEDVADDNAMLYEEVNTAEALLRRFALLASTHAEHVGHIFGDVAAQAGAWLEQFEQGGPGNG